MGTDDESVQIAGVDSPCKDTFFKYRVSSQNNNQVYPPALGGAVWHYSNNSSTLPDYMDQESARTAIRDAIGRMFKGQTPCPQSAVSSPDAISDGNTSQVANIYDNGGCDSSTDSNNTVGFGALPGKSTAVACVWWNNYNHIVETDMRFNKGDRHLGLFNRPKLQRRHGLERRLDA